MSNEVAVLSDIPQGGFALARYITEQARPLASLAEMYVRGGLVPAAVLKSPNPNAVAFTILTTGMELGLAPASAMRTIQVIEGKASLSADLMAGLAMQVGVAFQYEQNDAQACVIAWTRGSSSGRVSFTIEEAKAAGLLSKDNWRRYPAAMLAARARAAAARQAAPDRLAGIYAPEELGALVSVAASGEVQVVDDPPSEPVTAAPTGRQAEAGAQRGASPPSAAAPAKAAPVSRPAQVAPAAAPAEVAGGEPAPDLYEPGEKMTTAQQKMLMALAAKLGAKLTAEIDGQKRVVLANDFTIAAELALPSDSDPIRISRLTARQASILIDIYKDRDREQSAEAGQPAEEAIG